MDRSRRTRKNDSKISLIHQLKEAKDKGEKVIIEKTEKPVYDLVTDAEYAKIVKDRLENDIVEENDLGYNEDGREIFDDNDEDEYEEDKPAKPTKSKKSINPDIRPSAVGKGTPSTDIRNMFNNMPKSKPESVNIKTDMRTIDNDVDDLLNEEVPLPKKSTVYNPFVKSEPKEKKSSKSSKKKHKKSHHHSPKKSASKRVLETSPQAKKSSKRIKVEQEDESIIEASFQDQSMAEDATIAESFVEFGEDPLLDDCSNSEFCTDAKKKEVKIKEELKEESVTKMDPDCKPSSKPYNNEVIFSHDDGTFTESILSKDKEDYKKFIGDSTSGTLNFFWYDAYEDAKVSPGTIYLFGKILATDGAEEKKIFKTCCLIIKELERNVYLLPKADSNSKLVYQEFSDIAAKCKINKFKCKPVKKLYSFELDDVPNEAEYLQVKYSAAGPTFPHDSKFNHISRVFGANTSFLENFLLDRNIKGPCWLHVEGATPCTPQISWCQEDHRISFSRPDAKITRLDKHLESVEEKYPIPPEPPMKIASISIKSAAVKSGESQIICVGLTIDNNYTTEKIIDPKKVSQQHYLIVSNPKDMPFPYDLKQKLPTWGPNYTQPNIEKGKHSGVDVEYGGGERALLNKLLTKITFLDPDLIIGHDLWGNQLDLLMHRMSALNISTWHRLSRLRRAIPIKNIIHNSHGWIIRNAFPGRLFCDTKMSAKDLVHARSYNLTELCRQVMPGGNEKVTMRYVPPTLDNLLKIHSYSDNIEADFDSILDSIDLSKMFANSNSVRELIDFCISEANLVLRLVHQLQALPLAFQITSICGNILSRTLAGGRSERNEWLLLHAFSSANYIVPDPPAPYASKGRKNNDDELGWIKQEMDVKAEDTRQDPAAAPAPTGKRKPAYAGGLVLDPKVGFYDKFILLLDFNSLYPSIIQEFNICFTSVNRSLMSEFTSDETSAMNKVNGLIEMLVHGISQTMDLNETKSDTPLELPINKPIGMLPAEIKKLVDSRKAVKKLIASANNSTKQSQLAQWDIRQKALKITANSVYGCLGFAASRFYAKPLAAIVTGLGRCLLMDTKERVENLNHEVIYGDTDSIMVNTNSRDLFSALFIGDKVRNEINKRYKLLELDTDGVYASILLLAKKKYAALSIINPTKIPKPANGSIIPFEDLPKKQELKGLDIVRRDWSPLAANVGRFVVSALLGGQSEKDAIVEKIHSHLAEIANKIKENKIPLKEFTITKMLTKNPESYPDKKGQPHVSVALRTNANRTTNRLGAGDTVEYIICNDGTSGPATQRAYSPAEYMESQKIKPENGDNKENDKVKLEIDTKYYLANQIHPVVCRLIAPIEETSASHIAEHLGLDAKQYGGNKYQDNDDTSTNYTETLSLQKYNDCIPFVLFCPEEACKGKIPTSLRFPAFPTSAGAKTSWICQHCSRELLRSEEDMIRCLHMIQIQMRICQLAYYQGVMRCSDSACRSLDRGALSSIVLSTNKFYCLHCAMINGESQMRMIVSEGWLFKQLNFYKSLFAMKQGYQISHVKLKYLKLVEEAIDREVESNPYGTVDLGDVFSSLTQGRMITA